MERSDFLKTDNEVRIAVYGPDGDKIYDTTGNGFHSIEGALNNAIENANLQVSPEDCVFEVTNQTTGVSHRYRINAHGNLKLIV